MPHTLRKVYVELTDKCNLSCSICYRQQWIHELKEMDKPLLRSIANQINGIASIDTVVIGGMGEPMTSPFFEEAIDLFRERNVCVTTNATYFKQKLTREIVSGVKLFVVSIDGMEEQMKKSRGVSFSALMDSIDYFNSIKREFALDFSKLDVQFVASKQNISDIFPLMDTLAEKNIRNLIISHLLPQNLLQAENILYKPFDNKPTKELFHKIRNYSFKRGINAIFPEVELKTERGCAFVKNSATYISSNGNITPCYRFSHDGSENVFGRQKTIQRYSFGNLADNHLEHIWNSAVYDRFRERIFNYHYPSCPDCDFVEGCSLVHDTKFDCNGDEPNCSDCLWSRNFVFCS